MFISSNNEIIMLYWIGVLTSFELKISLLESNSNAYIIYLQQNTLPLLIYW